MSVEPYDEKAIGGRDLIIRRISPAEHIVWDENRKKHRIASKAYSKSSGLKDGMSVDIEELIKSDGLNPKVFVTNPTYLASVSFTAGDVRALDLWVGYNPILNVPNISDNPYHGEVWCKTERKHFSNPQKEGLARIASWYVELPDVDLR